VCLDILVDGVVRTQTLANRYRADLAVAGVGSGRHAFSVHLAGFLSVGDRREVVVRRSSDQTALPASHYAFASRGLVRSQDVMKRRA
jgi:hypothetical protein